MSNDSGSALVEKLKAKETMAATQEAANVQFGFADSAGFAMMQRAAQLLASSTLVPQQFRGNISDCVIAIEMARRLGASPLAVMQSIYIVHGRPSWSAQFIIACLNASGRFSPLRFEMSGDGMTRACVAWATDLATGDRLDGPAVTIAMAKAEGWYDRKGKDGAAASKWPTMPELMLRYRAAMFFGRLYASDIMMGMQTREELEDRIIEHGSQDTTAQTLPAKIKAAAGKLPHKPTGAVPPEEDEAPTEEPDHTPEPGVPPGDIGADDETPTEEGGARGRRLVGTRKRVTPRPSAREGSTTPRPSACTRAGRRQKAIWCRGRSW